MPVQRCRGRASLKIVPLGVEQAAEGVAVGQLQAGQPLGQTEVRGLKLQLGVPLATAHEMELVVWIRAIGKRIERRCVDEPRVVAAPHHAPKLARNDAPSPVDQSFRQGDGGGQVVGPGRKSCPHHRGYGGPIA